MKFCELQRWFCFAAAIDKIICFAFQKKQFWILLKLYGFVSSVCVNDDQSARIAFGQITCVVFESTKIKGFKLDAIVF
jgi:hypothetical protein